MGKSKIVYGNEVLIDLTNDTVKADKLLKDCTAHGADGEPITGACTYDVDSSGATATADEILLDKTAAKGGKMLTGAMPNNGAVTLKITEKTGKVSVPRGYHDGSGYSEIDPTEQAKLIADNIREGITILGVEGTMSGSEDVKAQAKSVTPSTSEQTVLPDEGYNSLASVVVAAIPYTESENTAGGITVTIG